MTGKSTSADVERLKGVPLAQLAAVHAALGEGFLLEQVLATEKLAPDVWTEAEVAWKQRLAEDPLSFADYKSTLAAEQQRMARPVEPLDHDLDAWVHFLAAYARHPDPFDLLDGLGMRMNDLARLSRSWADKMKRDARLGKRAAKLASKLENKRVQLPLIAVGKSALSPSKYAGSYDKQWIAELASAGPAAPPVLGLAEYAALSAELALAKSRGERNEVLRRFALTTEEAADVEAAWEAMLAGDRELMHDFRALVGHHLQRSKLGRKAAREPRRPVAPRPAAAPPPEPGAEPTRRMKITPRPFATPATPPASLLDQTAPMMMAPLALAPVPFRGHIDALPPAAPSVTKMDSVDATGDLIPALVDEPALPFGSLNETAFLQAALVLDDALPFSVNETAGAMPALRLADEPLPFRGSVASLPLAAPEWGDAGRIDATLGLDVSLLGLTVVPFDDPDEPEHQAPEPAPDSDALPLPTLEPTAPPAQVVRSELDSTTLFEALDLGDLDGLDDSDEDEAATLARPDPPPLPSFTVAQLASLHAELSVHPEHGDAIRRRYHLTDRAMQERLDAAWRERFRQRPGELADYHQKLAEYQRWLHAQRRG